MYNHLGNRCETISSREKIIARARRAVATAKEIALSIRAALMSRNRYCVRTYVRTSTIRGDPIICARGFTFLRESARPRARATDATRESHRRLTKSHVTDERHPVFLCALSCFFFFYENHDTRRNTRVIRRRSRLIRVDSSACVARESSQNSRAIVSRYRTSRVRMITIGDIDRQVYL